MVCRFNIGQFLTDSAIVAEPLPDDLYEEKKKQLQRWKVKSWLPVYYAATHFMVLLRHFSTCKKIILAHKYH